MGIGKFNVRRGVGDLGETRTERVFRELDYEFGELSYLGKLGYLLAELSYLFPVTRLRIWGTGLPPANSDYLSAGTELPISVTRLPFWKLGYLRETRLPFGPD